MAEKHTLEKRIRQSTIDWGKELHIQPDAIVSRILLDKETGTLTVFAFDRGQALSEHTSPFDALVHILEGRMEISLAGRSMPVQAGESLIMPAGVPHALKAVAPAKMLLVMIR